MQLKKADSPILFTLGNEILTKLAQLAKALRPIVVALGNDTLSKLRQFAKHASPIVITFSPYTSTNPDVILLLEVDGKKAPVDSEKRVVTSE